MRKRKFLLTILLALLTILILQGNSNAAYQSISTGYGLNRGAADWVIEIRKMESQNGGMGLNETIDETNALSTSGSNNIDVHMQKNTEYGAAILLGASDYGKQGTGTGRYMNTGEKTTYGTGVKASTTGNVTGIYELGETGTSQGEEWTAGGGINFLRQIAAQYKNIYEKEEGKAGDATREENIDFGITWHGRELNYFATGNLGFVRGWHAVFSYGHHWGTSGMTENATNYSRAAIVSATGI